MKTRMYFVFLALILVAGCASPGSFIRTLEPTWATIELRENLDYETAWNTVVDRLVKKFDLNQLSKPDGYIRTNWLYTWTGTVTENYRVRVTCKFSSDRRSVEIKSEAEYNKPYQGWVKGYDTRLLTTIKADIMGKIGRTTR